MRCWRAAALLLSLLAPAAHAQFSLYQVSGNADLPVGALFSFPTASPNMPEAVTFLIRNSTNQAQTLALLSMSGVGFSLTGAAAPVTLQAGGSVQFTVTFEAATVASYSGSLVATGISVTLTANVVPGLTYEVQLPSGGRGTLGPAAVNFGSVQVGANATVNFLVVNLTTAALTVDPISVAPGDFALVGPSPGGTSLDPQTSASFSIEFSPTAAGARRQCCPSAAGSSRWRAREWPHRSSACIRCRAVRSCRSARSSVLDRCIRTCRMRSNSASSIPPARHRR